MGTSTWKSADTDVRGPQLVAQRRAQPSRYVSPLLATLAVVALFSAAVFPARAAGDAAAGKKLYDMRCLGCHGDTKTKGTQAPSLVGVIGRQAGSTSDGTTSRALSESGIIWTEASLNTFLINPGSTVHGSIMPIGVKGEQEREDLIAYIKSMR